MNAPRFKLYYWPIPFRGCFASYIMAYHEIPFIEETSIDENESLMNQSPQEQEVPFIGPPLLYDFQNGKSLSQMPAIIFYISKEFGLLSQDSYEVALQSKIIMDCNDVLMEICRYNGSSMWDRDSWIDFRGKRLPKWMKLFEELANRNYLTGPKTTVSDICTYALFGNMIRCLPDLEKDLNKNAPSIHSLCKRVQSHPPLEKFVTDQYKKYGNVYCDGKIEESIREMIRLDTKQGCFMN